MIKIYHYPKCSTCKNAIKWLKENNIEFDEKDITKDTPTKEELKKFLDISKNDIKKFFNTSGILYREMGLKDKLKEMDENSKLQLLASDGMLIKRPLVIGEDFVITGFKADNYKAILK